MLVRNPSVLWRELDGEAILLNPKEGCSYNLNPVGTLIWKLLDGQHTTTDIIATICEVYEVEPEQASQDAKVLLDDMRTNKLIDSSPSPV
ncbi:MAG TPA: PqqD family protein [Ktedonobacteraceae bacterium]|nr:PqqD family protein [Ktedonobacteraceae bacterium]